MSTSLYQIRVFVDVADDFPFQIDTPTCFFFTIIIKTFIDMTQVFSDPKRPVLKENNTVKCIGDIVNNIPLIYLFAVLIEYSCELLKFNVWRMPDKFSRCMQNKRNIFYPMSCMLIPCPEPDVSHDAFFFKNLLALARTFAF